jgi:hypothetical protein
MIRRSKGRRRNLRCSQNRYNDEFERLKRIIYKSRNWPIHECIINESWKKYGLANIVVSRLQPNKRIVFGSYLVDVFCLGLKDTFCNADFTKSEFEEFKEKFYRESPPIICSHSSAHTIIYGGIEFASSLGFKPHEDFSLSRYILDEPGSFEKDESIEFGENGKPLYIQGPYDDPHVVVDTLSKNIDKIEE